MRRVSPLAGIFLMTACSLGDGGTGPTSPDPGDVVVRVVAHPDHAGIARLMLTGYTGPVALREGYRLWQQIDSTTMLLLIHGPISTGELIRFRSDDRREPYSVEVVDVAAGAAGGYALLPPAALVVTVDVD